MLSSGAPPPLAPDAIRSGPRRVADARRRSRTRRFERRGSQVVDGTALEMRRTRKGTVGSNPTLSANSFAAPRDAREPRARSRFARNLAALRFAFPFGARRSRSGEASTSPCTRRFGQLDKRIASSRPGRPLRTVAFAATAALPLTEAIARAAPAPPDDSRIRNPGRARHRRVVRLAPGPDQHRRRASDEAKVDAQLALAVSERAQTQRDADELARTLEALEQEVEDERD